MSPDFSSITVFVDKRNGGVFKLTTERGPDDPVGDYEYEAPLLGLSCSDISTGVDPDGRRYIRIPCLKSAACVSAAWWGENVTNSHPPFNANAINFYFAVNSRQATELSKLFSHYIYLAQRELRASQAKAAESPAQPNN
jgi:hypothetical protein